MFFAYPDIGIVLALNSDSDSDCSFGYSSGCSFNILLQAKLVLMYLMKPYLAFSALGFIIYGRYWTRGAD